MKYALATLLLLLTGCAQMAEYQRQAEENRRQADISRCSDFGYSHGSKEHADCMFHLYQERQEEERRREEQYANERLLQEMKAKDCKTTRQRVKRKDGVLEVVERTTCR